MIFLFFLILSIFLIENKERRYYHTNKEKNLFFIFTTFRHGARNPLFSSDIFGNKISHPGVLTKYGGIQHLNIGKKYRKRYSNFLNINFDKKEMYIRSSDAKRTINSTEKELEGLFNKTIDKKNIHIVKNGGNSWNLFHFEEKEKKQMEKYLKSCKKRLLNVNYKQLFKTEIII